MKFTMPTAQCSQITVSFVEWILQPKDQLLAVRVLGLSFHLFVSSAAWFLHKLSCIVQSESAFSVFPFY